MWFLIGTVLSAMRIKNKQQQIVGLVLWLLLCFGVSALGALGSMQAPVIYGQMMQPAWAPPAWLFGPVWSLLYAMMAVAAWLVWRRGHWADHGRALGWFLVQLAVNALWSWVFFAWLLGAWSVINIVLLWLLIVITMVAFWRLSRLAACLLIPYVLWVSFAAALNYAMWQLNPTVLGAGL